MAANQFGTAAAYAAGWLQGTPFGYWINQTLECGNSATPLKPSLVIDLKTTIDGGTASSLPTDMIPSRGAL